ncbi:hypothetical protein [Pseudomonas sp. dw_358]|uniref:hypothetical protein n=1 Tax=Pseudomonas sp. dw_358 TaxID=2720083 RepID=UPI001BD58C59|nr:hypothetical protein [Pseudomonas sp. dw_358]
MNLPAQFTPLSADDQIQHLRDVQDVLTLLSVALAIIAAPHTSLMVARVTAVVAQHTAMAWAELLGGFIAEHGGAQ